MSKKAFGSGYFGEWIEDEFGLPAYRYTCNQIKDPKAVTPMNNEWRSKTEHLHLVGNDRLVGVASNYGYIQVRQDEGSPKYLNEYDPEHGHYAGGFGYLTDGKNVLSTLYLDNGDTFERIFGIGYFKKKVESQDYNVNQIIFAPFGDDPVLISQITITNNRKEASDLRWIEYWGCNMYQFSSKAYMALLLKQTNKHPRKLRHEFSEQFLHEFQIINNGKGLQEEKFLEDLKGKFDPDNLVPEFEDKFPPKTFLISLDANADGVSTNEMEFFGSGGIKSPDGIRKALNNNINSSGTESAMFLERQIYLESGESHTLFFLYGYLPEGFDIENLITKYSKNLPLLLKKSCEQWNSKKIELSIEDQPWVNREVTWHNYYLRGAMTYDSFFKEHILSQGHVYQYIIGFQGAARDPLQHALPFIFIEPSIVKNIIRYTLKTVRKNGEIPFGITGNGQILPLPFKPSDLEMWLLWLTSEYILACRDIEFLNERIVTYPIYKSNPEVTTVLDLIYRCYHHLTKKTGTGIHGLQRLSNGDWNDGIIKGNIPQEMHDEIQEKAESVLNAAMAIYTLKIFSEMLNFIEEKDKANEALNYSNNQSEAVRTQWTGKWFRRAWLTENLGWIGEDQLWLEPQSWAIIGEAANQEQKSILVQSIDNLMRKPSKIGAKLLSKGINSVRSLGRGINGGIWPSINGTLIWALTFIDNEMAWDEWKKNTLAYHAENYPDVWYGIWSGPDFYNSDLSKYPGQTGFDESLITGEQTISEDGDSMGLIGVAWTDFPVFNLHPHAWPLFNTSSLIGVKFTRKGVELRPSLPKERYKFSSPLLNLEKTKSGYSGWYKPIRGGNWTLSLELSKEEIDLFKTILINGKISKFSIEENKIVWNGESKIDKPLIWKLEK